MKKPLAFIALLLISSGCFAQAVGTVDRKTKEFSISPNQKSDYTVFGYQFANASTAKLICFASNDNIVRANSNLKLGGYFDTARMPPGDRIVFLGYAGTFAKMNFITGAGTKVIFYLPKTSIVMK
jgi:hypothetical protein